MVWEQQLFQKIEDSKIKAVIMHQHGGNVALEMGAEL